MNKFKFKKVVYIMNEKKYLINQAVLSASGNGDYFTVASFAAKKEAVKEFNRIKRNTNGFTQKGHFLVTEIINTCTDESIEYFEILIK